MASALMIPARQIQQAASAFAAPEPPAYRINLKEAQTIVAVPLVVAGLSAVVLAAQAVIPVVIKAILKNVHSPSVLPTSTNGHSGEYGPGGKDASSSAKESVFRRVLKGARFLSVAILLALAMYAFTIVSKHYTLELLLDALYIYSFLLAPVSIFASPKWQQYASLHLTAVLLTTFAASFVLHVYPVFFNGTGVWAAHPAWLVWTRFTFLFIAGVFIPFILPGAPVLSDTEVS